MLLRFKAQRMDVGRFASRVCQWARRTSPFADDNKHDIPWNTLLSSRCQTELQPTATCITGILCDWNTAPNDYLVSFVYFSCAPLHGLLKQRRTVSNMMRRRLTGSCRNNIHSLLMMAPSKTRRILITVSPLRQRYDWNHVGQTRAGASVRDDVTSQISRGDSVLFDVSRVHEVHE